MSGDRRRHGRRATNVRSRHRSRRSSRPSRPARGSSPAARTSSWARARASGRCRSTSSRSTGSMSSRDPADRRRRAVAGRARRPTTSWPRTRRSARSYTALADAAAIVGSRATRNVGTLGGNIVNASPAAETVGPLDLLRGERRRAPLGGRRARRRSPSSSRARGRTVAASGRVARRGGAAGSRPPERARATRRLEYRRQMEIAVVGATAVVTIDGGRVTDARVAITALAPTIRRVPEAEAALNGSDGGREAAELAAQAAAAASRPIDDVRAPADYRRAMAAVITRRVVAAAVDAGARRRRCRFPPAPRSTAHCEGWTMKYAATLRVNGFAYPSRSSRGRTLLSVLRDDLGLTGTKEGCDDSECGACMVLVDGRPVNSLLVPRAPGRRPAITTVEGLATRRRAAPAAARVPRGRRRPVRLLHARDAHLRDGAAARGRRARPTRRFAPGWPATSAAARATSRSSPRSSRRPRRWRRPADPPPGGRRLARTAPRLGRTVPRLNRIPT